MAAVTVVLLTNVVWRSEPLNRTIEVAMKFVPVTVRVKAASPAVLLVGEIALMVGTGLFVRTTVNVVVATTAELPLITALIVHSPADSGVYGSLSWFPPVADVCFKSPLSLNHRRTTVSLPKPVGEAHTLSPKVNW